jgi:TIR domain-containing protein
MADIFLSYAREDQQRASLLADALAAHGWSVWWDRQIPHGHDFNTYIQQQLDTARCIVVLWSNASLDSKFVRDEAAEGLNGRLVPVLIEAVRQPLGFRQLQAANLSGWDGRSTDEEWDRLVESITSIVPPSPAPALADSPTIDAARRERPTGRTRLSFPTLAAFIAGVIIAVALIAFAVISWRTPSGQPVSGNPPARPSVEELEERLLRVNISLSTGTNADRERVLGYVRDPETPYRLLGEACLEVMNGRRFKEPEYLDMIDKWYTLIVGAGNFLTADGTIRLQDLKDAMVRAHNDYHSRTAQSYDEIVE